MRALWCPGVVEKPGVASVPVRKFGSLRLSGARSHGWNRRPEVGLAEWAG